MCDTCCVAMLRTQRVALWNIGVHMREPKNVWKGVKMLIFKKKGFLKTDLAILGNQILCETA